MMSATLIGLVKWPMRLTIAIISALVLSNHPLCAGQALLNLKPVGSNMQGHRIFMRTEGQTYDYSQWVYQRDQNTITIDHLVPETVYYFVARAFSGAFESTDSNEVRFIITDSDKDGINDHQEIARYGTDPNNPDTNQDGMNDGQGLIFWGDHWQADHDQDGVINMLDLDASFAQTQNPESDLPYAAPSPVSVKDGKSYQWLEAEDGDVYHPMKIDSEDNQHPLIYVQLETDKAHSYDWLNRMTGAVVHPFNVSIPGRYHIWGRVFTGPHDGDAFWVSVDNGPYALWVFDQTAQWQWHRVHDSIHPGEMIYDLMAGNHTLIIQHNQDSPKLDRLLITNDEAILIDDPSAQDQDHTKVWFEAEDGEVTYPMFIGKGEAPCSRDYVQVSKGSEDFYSWPGRVSGAAIYHFQVPRSGAFVIWGRVLALDRYGDALWVSVDGGPYHLWGLDQSTQWMWRPVRIPNGSGEIRNYNLSAGNHTFTIRAHELSPKIDQILITDHPEFFASTTTREAGGLDSRP